MIFKSGKFIARISEFDNAVFTVVQNENGMVYCHLEFESVKDTMKHLIAKFGGEWTYTE